MVLWMILEPGEVIEYWDEFFDVDENEWVRVPERLAGRTAKREDVIRRRVGDVISSTKILISHVEKLRTTKKVSKEWFDVCDQYICEIKRRMGERSIGRVKYDGRVVPSVEVAKKPTPSLDNLFSKLDSLSPGETKEP